VAQPYVGEIRLFAGNFEPVGWVFCNGKTLQCSEYETLFLLIGTTYGGDGISTFCVPDMRGRIPVHQGAGFTLAQTGGTEAVTLTANQIPAHSHRLLASTDSASARVITNAVFGRGGAEIYSSEFTPQPISALTVAAAGGSQAHTNVQPFLCINYIISLFGLFPSPT
jgi:microcystin-dependent protein